MTSEQVKYRKAIERLDEIISKIEHEEVDIDELSKAVKEAVELIRLCKAKIDQAQMEIKQVVEDFAQEIKETKGGAHA